MESLDFAQLGPAVIGCYLLMDRAFRFVSERNGRNPQNNLRMLVKQNDEILIELRRLRLDIRSLLKEYEEAS
jgi:hypothetical protein